MYSFIYAFTLWFVVAGSGVLGVLLLLRVGARREKRFLENLFAPIRCPKCGGMYDLETVSEVQRAACPRGRPPHAIGDSNAPAPPPELEVACGACGLVGAYSMEGRFLRTGSLWDEPSEDARARRSTSSTPRTAHGPGAPGDIESE